MEAAHIAKDVLSSRFESEAVQLLIKRSVSEAPADQAEPAGSEEMGDARARALHDVQYAAEVRDALDHAKSLKGKSARAIEFQLKANALMNLSRSEEIADIRKYQRESVVHVVHDDHQHQHQRLMEEHQRNLTDLDKVTEPLVHLSHEMKNYKTKSRNNFIDQRSARAAITCVITPVCS